jgi:HTH-type transcriptional regulator / antitoxin HigA
MNATSPSLFEPNYASPPGMMLEEWLEENDITQAELAQRSGRATKTINQIIKGIAPVTPEMALDLEKVTGVSASLWSSMEAHYRQYLAREAERDLLAQASAEWVPKFSYKKMSDFGWVPPTTNKTERAGYLLHFYGVASFQQWESTYTALEGAARESASFKSLLPDLSAWIRRGEIEAAQIKCSPFDEQRFKENLATIRKLTAVPVAEQCPRLRTLCAEAGVAFVLVPELPATHINGFTRWLSPSKALIQQSLRHKREDHLWFTFFHEAAHILLHGKKEKFLDFQGRDDPKESEANAWAAEYLIPAAAWTEFSRSCAGIFTETKLAAFARQLEIAPGIVAGRAQRETRLFHRFNGMIRKLTLAPGSAGSN